MLSGRVTQCKQILDLDLRDQTKNSSQDPHDEQENWNTLYFTPTWVTGASPWSQVRGGARQRAPGGWVCAHGARLGTDLVNIT